MEEGRKVVFISYSWEEIEHQNWVLKLAGDLQSRHGIKVIIDKASLELGSDLPYFMESSIDKADKVLIILTPEYKVKSENRTKGVGYETTMLSQELFESPITQIKIIPILRKGNKGTSSPKFLNSKLYHSMLDDDNYDYQLLDLAKAINDQSTIQLPDLAPLNSDSEEIDPFIAKANRITNEELINREIDQLLFSYEGKNLADKELARIEQMIKDKQNLYESNTDLKFTFESNNRDRFIIKTYGFSVSSVFENVYSNAVNNLKLRIRYFKGNISLNGGGYHFPGEEPIKLKELEYLFDLNYQKEVVWKIKSQTFTADEVTTSMFSFILDKIQEEKSKKFRGK